MGLLDTLLGRRKQVQPVQQQVEITKPRVRHIHHKHRTRQVHRTTKATRQQLQAQEPKLAYYEQLPNPQVMKLLNALQRLGQRTLSEARAAHHSAAGAEQALEPITTNTNETLARVSKGIDLDKEILTNVQKTGSIGKEIKVLIEDLKKLPTAQPKQQAQIADKISVAAVRLSKEARGAEILNRLTKGPCHAGQIAAGMGFSRIRAVQLLAELEQQGKVHSELKGRMRFYSLPAQAPV